MQLATDNFLLSLAVALGAACEPALTVGTEVFVQSKVEAGTGSEAPYVVLRNYGGGAPDPMRPIPTMSVQIMATAKTRTAAQDLAEKIYEACFDDEEGTQGDLPRHHWTIAGMKIVNNAVAADAGTSYEVLLMTPSQQPYALEVDDKGRHQAVFNFDVRYQVYAD